MPQNLYFHMLNSHTVEKVKKSLETRQAWLTDEERTRAESHLLAPANIMMLLGEAVRCWKITAPVCSHNRDIFAFECVPALVECVLE